MADSFTIPDTSVGRKSRPNQVDFGGRDGITARRTT